MPPPTGPHDSAIGTPGTSYSPGKGKEPPEAGKVSQVTDPVVIQSPPTPRGLPGEEEQA